jgi:hypothetical protein
MEFYDLNINFTRSVWGNAKKVVVQ